MERPGFAEPLLSESGLNRLRIAQAERLFGLGGNLIDETGREPVGGARFLMVAQATRAQHTFEGVITLARIGRGVQAAMLNRALLEDVLDIHWTAAHPDEAADAANLHDRLLNLGERRLEASFDRGQPLSSEENAELDGLIDHFGGRGEAFRANWHRASTEECLDLVRERWRDQPEAGSALSFIFEVIQRRNNVLLHGSPTAYRQTLSERPDGGVMLNRVGPDEIWMDSLQQGAGGYYLVMRLLAEEFQLDKEALAEVFSRTTSVCRRIEELPSLAGIPAGSPCPCGSELPAEQCHRP